MSEFDIVDDLANPITAMVTLEFIGIPVGDWLTYLTPIHEQAYVVNGTAEFEEHLNSPLLFTGNFYSSHREG